MPDMTTVLIVLLAYPVATVALNTVASAGMACLWRKEGEFVHALLFGGLPLKFVLYPYWITALSAVARLAFWTAVVMARGRWHP